jgi:uncharacterized protein (TIGR02588 family)
VSNPTEHWPALQWIAAVVGALVTATILGFCAWGALTGADEPPAFHVEAEEAVPRPDGSFLVPIEVRNDSPVSAASVLVVGELDAGAGPAGRAEARFDYLAARSRVRGGLLFGADPRRHRLVLRVAGYAEP